MAAAVGMAHAFRRHTRHSSGPSDEEIEKQRQAKEREKEREYEERLRKYKYPEAPDEKEFTPDRKRDILADVLLRLGERIKDEFVKYLASERAGDWKITGVARCVKGGQTVETVDDVKGCDATDARSEDKNEPPDIDKIVQESQEGRDFVAVMPVMTYRIEARYNKVWSSSMVLKFGIWADYHNFVSRVINARVHCYDGTQASHWSVQMFQAGEYATPFARLVNDASIPPGTGILGREFFRVGISNKKKIVPSAFRLFNICVLSAFFRVDNSRHKITLTVTQRRTTDVENRVIVCKCEMRYWEKDIFIESLEDAASSDMMEEFKVTETVHGYLWDYEKDVVKYKKKPYQQKFTVAEFMNWAPLLPRDAKAVVQLPEGGVSFLQNFKDKLTSTMARFVELVFD